MPGLCWLNGLKVQVEITARRSLPEYGVGLTSNILQIGPKLPYGTTDGNGIDRAVKKRVRS